jgi:tryptophan halogenase
LPNTQTDFGLEGFLIMFVGNKVPYRNRYTPTPQEAQIWKQRKAGFIQEASRGIRSEEALAYVHHPGWKWNADPA